MTGRAGLARLRTLGVGLLVVIGSTAFGVYVLAHWVERQILTTDNWVATVAPLPKQPVVSTALGSYISSQLFNAVPVEARISEALPPQAGFLAAPLTSQLQSITTQASQKMVASDAFQTVWTGANRIAINRLVANARGEDPPLRASINERFSIDLAGSTGQVRNALGRASEAIPALQPASQKAVAVSADLQARPRRLQQAVRTVDFLAATLPFVTAACLLGALALSARRRRTTLAIAGTVVVILLIELIMLKWARQEVLSLVRQPGNIPAISYIFDTLVGSLRQTIFTLLGSGIVVLGITLAAGRTAWARSLQTSLSIHRLKQTKAAVYWQSFRRQVARWQRYIWLTIGIGVLATLALVVDVTTVTIINSLLLMCSLLALVHIIASPRSNDGQPSDAGIDTSLKRQGGVTGVTV